MTIFSDGFETNDFTLWTGTSGVGTHTEAVETNNPHSGTYNAKFSCSTTNSESWAYKTFTATAKLYCRYYIKLGSTSLPDDASFLCMSHIGDSGNPQALEVFIWNDGGTYYWGLTSAVDSWNMTHREVVASNPTTDVWYCCEILRDNTNNVATLWVDGVQKLTVSLAFTTNSVIAQVGINYNPDANDVSAYYDDVVVDSSYIGPIVAGGVVRVASQRLLMGVGLAAKTPVWKPRSWSSRFPKLNVKRM